MHRHRIVSRCAPLTSGGRYWFSGYARKVAKSAKVTNSVKVAPSVVTNDDFAHVLAGLQVSERRSGFAKQEHSINFWL